ncbi:MAG: hypothetical protein A07HR60_02339 [uncultured archaeon A07HR60]|jgi:hypothetical protein|nr:MAG: hypothetical protein A07HR60_02339 [uncultured archaeon A07HR60]
MSESAPLRNRLRADLTDNQWVTVTAIGLAVAAFVLASLDNSPLLVSADFGAEFLFSLSLMDMAFVYDDYWPVEYRPMYAVAWTILSGGVTTIAFLSVYGIGLSQVGNTTASIAAFLIAVGLQLGSAIVYARTR